MQMHRHEDLGGGRGECSLNVSVTSPCHDASCRDVVPTFESAGQRKMKEERNREEERRGVNETEGQQKQKDG